MIKGIINLARPVQWLKNSIVLAPLLFAGTAGDFSQVKLAIIATFIFCLLSSAIYAFNDLLDKEKDRLHPLKKDRPIASGVVTEYSAIFLIIFLLLVSGIGSMYLGSKFQIVAILFLTLNAAYSLFIKEMVILDVMSIAISFVIRAYAGSVAIDVPASEWLLINTLFLALFLAFGKRRHELILLEDKAAEHRTILGRYSPYLLDQCIGVTTASVVIMYMLYTFSSEVSEKLGTENLFLTIPFVVYGIFRYLYLIHKEERGGSPTRVLITDLPILINITLWTVTVIAILYFS